MKQTSVVEQYTAVAVGKKSDYAVDADNRLGYNMAAVDYIRRGDSDDKLLIFHNLASQSPNKWQVLETKANFIHGSGLDIPTRKKQTNATTGELMLTRAFSKEEKRKLELFKKMKLKNYLASAAFQLSFADEINIMVEWSDTMGEVPTLTVLDNNDVRVASLKPNETKIKGFWVSTEFGKTALTNLQDAAIYYPAFDEEKPKASVISIIHLIMPKPGQRFYGLPSWWGTKKWTEVTNNIPEYYEAIMANGAYATTQYSYPKNRFDIEGKTEQQISVLKDAFFTGVTDAITGVKKSGKVIFTEYEFDAMNKQLEDVKIAKIDQGVNDKAFIEMGEMGLLVQLSGHGTPPRLAGLQIGGNMGSSGKEVISEADFMQDYLMPIYKNLVVDPINIVLESLQIDVQFAVKRIESYTYDATSKSSSSHPNITEDDKDR
jgi:hypothetical protein